MTIDKNDKIYAASVSSYVFNKVTSDTSFLGRLPNRTWINGLAIIDSTVYATATSPQPGLIEFVPGGFPEINRFIPLQGTNTIVSYRDNDCKLKLLVSLGWRTTLGGPVTHRLISVDPVDLSFTTFCNRVEAPNFLGEPSELWGGLSYDRFLTTCDVRLDLDANDNSSRFGPHYYNDVTCTRSYRVTDSDIWLESKVGDIDSVTIRLRPAGAQPGFDRLRFTASPAVRAVAYGDTALTIASQNGSTQLDIERALQAIRLETTAPRPSPGERIVEFYAFSAGVRSDMARSFIQVVPTGLASAGPDTTFYVCRDSAINLFLRLAPLLDVGGEWSPSLYFGDTWNLGKPYGIYRYVVNTPTCGLPDTAYVTIAAPRPAVDYLSLSDTIVRLCPGDTATWNLGHPEAGAVRWSDGFNGRIRQLTTPGRYTAYIDNAAGCLPTDTVYLDVVSLDEDPSPGTSVVVACVGDTIRVGQTAVANDTTISANYQTIRGCDSIHLTTYRFTPAPVVKIQENICPGDTAFIADNFYTAPGSYQASIAGEGVCDTLLLIRITESPAYEATIDTSLHEGDTLRISGDVFTTSGTYNLQLSTVEGCDSLIVVTIDFTSSANDPGLTSGYFAPNPLRIGGPAFRFYPNETDAARLIGLEVFNLEGKLIESRSGSNISWAPDRFQAPAPTGVYFYRATLGYGSRTYIRTGKVVVIN